MSIRMRRSLSDLSLKQRLAKADGDASTGNGDSIEDYREELERLRKASGVADVLPAEPPQHRRIHHFEMPTHALRDSMLHSKSGFINYRGLYNLALIMLFVSGGRIAFGNYKKYGLLINPSSLANIFQNASDVLSVGVAVLTSMFPVLSMWIEKVDIADAALHSKIAAKAANSLHAINIIAAMGLPIAFVLMTDTSPLLAVAVMMQTCISWMKTISYTSVNAHYRMKEEVQPVRPGSPVVEKMVHYPDNLHLGDVAYFIAAPTLCYELNFPKMERIRWRFLLRRVLEIVLLFVLMLSMMQQWIQPTLANAFSRSAGQDVPLGKLIERTMTLSIPNNIIWLCLFYMFFHSMLNVIGELLKFGDRQFYRDWWNATSVQDFWKNWNVPVHAWAVRHMYRPIIAAGGSKPTAQILVFLLSAVLHELLVSVPLRMFRMWAFMAMVAQVPLALFADTYFKGTQYGNVIVWASLFFGQPAAIMLYVQAYIAERDYVPGAAP